MARIYVLPPESMSCKITTLLLEQLQNPFGEALFISCARLVAKIFPYFLQKHQLQLCVMEMYL